MIPLRLLSLARHVGLPLLSGLLVASAALAQSPSAGTTLSIGGAVKTPLSLTIDDLKKCASHDVVRRAEHPHTDKDGAPLDDHYTACLLRDVIEQAGLTQTDRFDLRRTYFLVTASDGYAVVYSWGEVFNSPLGDDIYVAIARNGVALADSEGQIALFSLKDTHPGPRYTRGIQSVQVLRAGSAH